jgi:hypothetical protein
MTNEIKNNYLYHKPLTAEALHSLQLKGYKYLQVQGFTIDHHAEYVEPHYLMLVPFKDLPMDIYEPINSELVNEWISNSANSDRLEVFLAGNAKNSYS